MSFTLAMIIDRKTKYKEMTNVLFLNFLMNKSEKSNTLFEVSWAKQCL